MARANAAYYAEKDPFKDFTTAPEITQVFGELLGAWSAVVWETLGRPNPVLLVECGPGRGTLMQDALRTIARVAPAFHAALHLHIVETSPRLRAEQASRLPAATWHDTIEHLPQAPFILLANEFLDALPIRQFVRRDGAWLERYIQAGTFTEAPLPPSLSGRDWEWVTQAGARVTQQLFEPPAIPEIIEHCQPALEFTTHLAHRLKKTRGAALILDYGYAHPPNRPTLQAIRDGHPADPLAHPGTADLTAHVDFGTLAHEARAQGIAVHGPIQQGPFLARLGLFQRTGILARTQPFTRAAALIDAAQRLAEPDRMGGLFKALCLCQPELPVPPGFEP